MRLSYKGLSAFALSLFVVTQTIGAYADGSKVYESKTPITISPKNVSDLQESFLKNIRLLQQKQAQQFLESQNTDTRRVSSSQQEASIAAVPLLPSSATTIVQDQTAIYNWFLQNQAASPLGLLETYPDDPGTNNQAFTYDQALAGILMLKQGDAQAAQKIFNFYNSQWAGDGFWTVYDTQSAGGSKIEYMKIMGSNAWFGLFCLHYYAQTGDARARDLATKIGKWIVSLPHKNGGVAMGNSDIWANLYSVENNLSYYALVDSLSTKAATSADRNLFQKERSNLKSWFKTEAYDPATGLFKRGAFGDTLKAFDTNAWAVLVFGVANLKNWFGINTDPNNSGVSNLIKKTENSFAVQNNGVFGGDTLTAKGFDFSDAANAGAMGRTGMKWVEGTNQMILVYNELYNYWKSKNSTKAAYYKSRMDYFTGRNAENSISQNGTLSYTYADQFGVQVFSDNPYWRTAIGAALPSAAWVYYSLSGINPFKI